MRNEKGQFIKGHISYWKDKKRPPFSKEWRRNLSEAHKGIKYPQERNKKLSEIAKRKGFGQWMKGKKLSEAHKRKIKKAHIKSGFKPPLVRYWLGKKRPPFSEEWKMNMSKSRRGKYVGEKSWNWKGGSSRNKHTLGSIKYKEWRDGIFNYDNYICWICEKRGTDLEAHHFKGWAKYIELRYEIKNGITLCRKCHKIYTF